MEVNENIICKGSSRKYYNFRKTDFYGGTATADCLGCNLRCAYCWAQKKIWHPEKHGKFYTAIEVSDKLIEMKQKYVRVSGGEPTLCKEHLLELITLIPNNKMFILETNGILLDEKYIRDLSVFKNLLVRVSLKGVDEESFEKITGVDGELFRNQFRALYLLKKYSIRHKTAILADLFTEEQLSKLVSSGIVDLELEGLLDYPHVRKSLKKRGVQLDNFPLY
jgi:uncharacterized Fe-S cluster-containing radical SAM superfamily protein